MIFKNKIFFNLPSENSKLIFHLENQSHQKFKPNFEANLFEEKKLKANFFGLWFCPSTPQKL